jgi:hypothetical protein
MVGAFIELVRAHRQGRIFQFAFFLCALTLALPAAPPSATLAWDPPTGTNVIASYSVYWGAASHTYTNKVSAGLALSVVVTNLSFSTTYFFAATAVDIAGFESEFSTEVFTNTPAAPPVRPNQPTNLRIRLGP